MPTASLTLLIRHLGHEGGREVKQDLASELSCAWWRLCCFCFFTKIKMKELIWKRCWGITVIDAYKLQVAAA